MKMYSSTTIGIACAAAVLLLLGLARLWVPQAQADIQLREIEIVTLAEPPPPAPPAEEPPPPAPPPPPALTQVSEIPDPSRVPIPKAKIPMDVTLPVDPFFTDVEISPLPIPVARPKPRPAPSKPSRETARAPAPRETTQKPQPREITQAPAPQRANYNVSELDGTPRLIRTGSTSFPSSLSRKGVTRGTVVLEVELSTSGSVRVRRVVSATHSELVSAARKVARGAKFTAPTRKGQRVKAIMRWPVTIKK